MVLKKLNVKIFACVYIFTSLNLTRVLIFLTRTVGKIWTLKNSIFRAFSIFPVFGDRREKKIFPATKISRFAESFYCLKECVQLCVSFCGRSWTGSLVRLCSENLLRTSDEQGERPARSRLSPFPHPLRNGLWLCKVWMKKKACLSLHFTSRLSSVALGVVLPIACLMRARPDSLFLSAFWMHWKRWPSFWFSSKCFKRKCDSLLTCLRKKACVYLVQRRLRVLFIRMWDSSAVEISYVCSCSLPFCGEFFPVFSFRRKLFFFLLLTVALARNFCF